MASMTRVEQIRKSKNYVLPGDLNLYLDTHRR